jgi:hypothetical protein
MAILYRNAKKEAQRQYDEITKDLGYTAYASPDGKTYQFKDKAGNVYKGKNPIGGIDSESGFKLRNRRQQRLVGELASSHLARPESTGVGAGTSGTGAGTTTGTGTVTGTGATTGTGKSLPSAQAYYDAIKFAMKPVEGKKTGDQDPIVEVPEGDLPEPAYDQVVEVPTTGVVPIGKNIQGINIYDPKKPNITARYIYMPKSERHKGRDVFGKRTDQEIAIEEAGGVTMPFGLSNLIPTAGAPEVKENITHGVYRVSDGTDNYTLRYNPDYQQDVFPTKEAAEVASKTFGHGEKASGTITPVTGKDGKTYYKLDRPFMQHVGAWTGGLASKAIDVAAAVGTVKLGANFLTKVGTKLFSKAAGKVAPKLIPKAAEQVAPGGKVVEEAAWKFGKKAKLVPKKGAGNVKIPRFYPKTTQIPQSKASTLPFDVRKCGGKLTAKKKSSKIPPQYKSHLKGKGK